MVTIKIQYVRIANIVVDLLELDQHHHWTKLMRPISNFVRLKYCFRQKGDVEIEIMINWTWRGFCGFHRDAFISLSSIFRVFWCLSQFSTSWSLFPGCWGTSPWSPWWSAAKVSTPRWITISSLSPSPTFSSSYSVSYIKSLPCIFLQHFVIITDGNTTIHNANALISCVGTIMFCVLYSYENLKLHKINHFTFCIA